jgi:hypothetical protein
MNTCHKNHDISYYIHIYLPKLGIIIYNLGIKVKLMLTNATQSKTLVKPKLNSH